MEEAKYKKEELILESGDTLFMYTDGVTEATDINNCLYSEKQLLKEADLCSREPAKDMAAKILQSIKSFTHGAPQSDDITILALKYSKTIK